MLVDSTSYDTASWTTYTSTNITANLGSLQGWHELWVGLKGPSPEATVTWVWKRLKLDTTPPAIVITSPTNSTVNVPLIQLTGYSVEALGSLRYDLSNALGLVTNQLVEITDEFYSTNTAEFTTNYFQCYDVPLTNGLNVITLHAVDLAGNMTTLAKNITLNYSNKPAPVIQLIWPQNGMALCGSSFIWNGWISDPTATVTAQTVDSGGNTNVFTGPVGRDGKFWLQNLPLNAGANTFTLIVTDLANNIATTNLTVIQGSAGLVIDPIPPNQTIVKGKINYNTYTVLVNGVPATISATPTGGVYTWEADNVPIPPNSSLVQVQAIPGGGQ